MSDFPGIGSCLAQRAGEISPASWLDSDFVNAAGCLLFSVQLKAETITHSSCSLVKAPQYFSLLRLRQLRLLSRTP